MKTILLSSASEKEGRKSSVPCVTNYSGSSMSACHLSNCSLYMSSWVEEKQRRKRRRASLISYLPACSHVSGANMLPLFSAYSQKHGNENDLGEGREWLISCYSLLEEEGSSVSSHSHSLSTSWACLHV